MADALVLAGTLRRLPGRPGATAITKSAMAETLAALGGGALDRAGFAAWWDAVVPAPASRRRPWNSREGKGDPPASPPLLVAACATQSWMEAGLTASPAPGQALLFAAAALARTGALHAVALPVWSAYPALGFGDRDTLPRLRADAVHRLVGWGVPVTWPLAFLHLVAENARMGLRELDRLAPPPRRRAGRSQPASIASRGCLTRSPPCCRDARTDFATRERHERQSR